MLTQLTEQLYAFTVPNCKKIDKAVINHGNHTFLEVGYWTHEGSLGICAEPLEGDWGVVGCINGLECTFDTEKHVQRIDVGFKDYTSEYLWFVNPNRSFRSLLEYKQLNVSKYQFIILKKL